MTEFPREEKPPPLDRAESPDIPILTKPRPAHRHRWVLYLFVAGTLAVALYFGWRIIQAWQQWMQQIMDS